MKKILCVLLIASIVLLSGCTNSINYNQAVNALNAKDYDTAITLFIPLADRCYKDSETMLLETKYQYVMDYFNRNDDQHVRFLEDLNEADYKDSRKFYEDTYSWKVKIAVSTTKQSGVHNKELNVTNKTFPIYWFNFRTYDGPIDGEYRGRYEVVFSNGQKVEDTYIGGDNDFYFGIALSATENPIGETIFNVYGENGELLATETSYIR
jgi:hypothetical protein